MEPKSKNVIDSDPDRSMGWFQKSLLPVRKAIIRGLAIVMPPLLTIVLFLWAWNIIDSYVLGPVEASVRHLIVWSISDVRDDREIQEEMRSRPVELGSPDMGARRQPDQWRADDGVLLQRVNQTWIPKRVFDVVESNPGADRPETAQAYFHRYVQLEYLPRQFVIPTFLIVFFLILYLLGRVFAVGFGRMIWNYLESVIHRLPIISKVYSSVKQVTDFAFSDSDIQFTRVVAVEYPRRGLYSIGFVTGESLLDIRNAANEPVISVLMPTSPMPATGFVISVPKSQTIDLNISIDQAIQFCVSCGVVVPHHQQAKTIPGAITSMPTIQSAESTAADQPPIPEPKQGREPGTPSRESE